MINCASTARRSVNDHSPRNTPAGAPVAGRKKALSALMKKTPGGVSRGSLGGANVGWVTTFLGPQLWPRCQTLNLAMTLLRRPPLR